MSDNPDYWLRWEGLQGTVLWWAPSARARVKIAMASAFLLEQDLALLQYWPIQSDFIIRSGHLTSLPILGSSIRLLSNHTSITYWYRSHCSDWYVIVVCDFRYDFLMTVWTLVEGIKQIVWTLDYSRKRLSACALFCCISKATIISRHSDWSGQLVSRIGFYREVYGAINILTDQYCIIDINSIDSNMSKGQCSSEDMWLWGASISVSSKTSYGKSS